jgi:hypothetical protein
MESAPAQEEELKVSPSKKKPDSRPPEFIFILFPYGECVFRKTYNTF